MVRDRIPEIIRQDGYTCRTETLDEQEFQQALREKIVEEAHELAEAGPDELVTELADLYEVLDTLMHLHHISHTDVRARQAERMQARGGFAYSTFHDRIKMHDLPGILAGGNRGNATLPWQTEPLSRL